MAGEDRRSPAHLIRSLLETAEQFDFFQAVRLLEQAVEEQARTRSTKPLGAAPSPRTEPVRFRADASRTFPSGDVSSISEARRRKQDEGTQETQQLATPVEMSVPFMGLTGPNGALPDHYTSLVIERSHQKTKDYALREFFDLFNHRAITLFYLAWRKHSITEEYRRHQNEGREGEDRFTAALFSIVGQGQPSLRQRFSFDDELILFYGGHFARSVRPAVGLQQVLSGFLHLPVRIREFAGRWIYLPQEVQSSMPTLGSPDGQNLCLGHDAVAGSQSWDEQSSFTVIIGPVDHATFQRLLPGSRLLKRVEDLTRLYAGPHFDFSIQLILRASDIPVCTLSGDASTGPRLGWTTWIGTAIIQTDSDDAVFRYCGIRGS
ncbi:MAG: type VI secretion system baseplate subunit TssG [Planctomycetaceae bacterium]|nr:type VI secretion system baseplate subunit TssG [Planctomycetaceae bacterium]